MKYFRIPLIALLALVFASGATVNTLVSSAAQTQSTALERGYRTGYSDGYSAGSRDVADKGARDYRVTGDYQRADRNYNEAWGTIEDYRDGYQQGFEAGYNAGYDRKEFQSTIPTGLSRRGATGPAPVDNDPDATVQRPVQTAPDDSHPQLAWWIERALGPYGHPRPTPRAGFPDGSHARCRLLGGFVGGGRRRELGGADPGALRPRAAG